METVELARQIRLATLRTVHRARASHLGTSLSMCDLLAVLYGQVLRVRAADPDWPDRDRFILSKGHGAAGYYAALVECGFLAPEVLDQYCQDGGTVSGHVTSSGLPGVEFSTGSLGHGLSVGCGMALAAKGDGAGSRVFVLLGDGECDEGSIWEAALFAGHHHLDNLVAIIDFNKIQSFGAVDEVMRLEPFADKWKSFGWSVREIDGHDHEQISDSLRLVPDGSERPLAVLAHTTKGKGVSFMENELLWHYRSPDEGDFTRAVAELEAAR